MVEALEIRNLRVSVKGKRLLDVPTLTIPAGRVVCVLGPNGAGKTTLVRALAGEIDDGDSMATTITMGKLSYSTAQWRQLGLVYHVLQAPHRNVFTNLTVAENLKLALYRRDNSVRVSVDQARSMWKPHLPALGQDHTLVRDASGGEKQGLAMLLAMARAPTMLLLDEHTASLDEKNKVHCASIVRDNLRSARRVILWVTQDLQLAREYADDFIVVKAGRLLLGGAPVSMDGTSIDRLLALCFGVNDG